MEPNFTISTKKILLEVVVFVCGAVVMIFELVGSRVVAPYVGTSIYVWTSLIGVILASLSAGYYVGGYLADRRPQLRPLALIILFAAVAIAFSAFTKDIFLLFISVSRATLEIKSVLISLILFAPASFLLGMVSPYAIRLRLSDVAQSGRTAGNLYAISTAGSIFGTFLAGFYIIPHWGSTNTVLALAALLTLTAFVLLIGSKQARTTTVAAFLVALFLGFAHIFSTLERNMLVADIDTEYNRIIVLRTIDLATHKPILALTTDPGGTQAAIFTDGTEDLVFDYTKFYRLFSHFVPNPAVALMLGGCAYTYPRDFLAHYPNAHMDVVEIDPGMTAIARNYFGLKDDPRLAIHHQDARMYLNENTRKYDVIFGDAFNSASSIPFQLTTQEAVQKEYDALTDTGVVMVNLISAVEGTAGAFARAEYATYKSVFPQVFLFQVDPARSGDENQNLMLVALKSDTPAPLKSADAHTNTLLAQVWGEPISGDVPLLTDDFAPVESYKRAAYY